MIERTVDCNFLFDLLLLNGSMCRAGSEQEKQV